MGTYEIFTYGSGNFIAQIFTGIALIFSGTAITDLVKIVLLVGLLVAVLNPVTSWLTKGQAPTFSGGEGIIAMLKQVLLAAIVMYALILPRANVAIIDRIDPNQNTIVGNVPMVQAFVAYGASQIGDKIGKEMETAFSLPDSMTFRNGGLGLGIKYIDTVFTIQPPGADVFNGGVSSNGSLIRQSLDDYFTECVFPNFTSTEGGTGDRTRALNALANSTNILETLALFHGIYDSTREITGANDTGKATCTSALADIRTAWGEIYPEWVKEIETKVSNGTSTNPDTLGTGIMTSEIISRYFPGSMSTQDKLINIAVVNAMRKATLTYEARFGDTNKTALELSTSSAVASWQTTARMFGAIVHTMRNVFEGLIYGLACLLPVAVAVVGLSALATYFKVVLWLQLWVPFYVLLNLFGDMEMTRALQSLSLQTDNPTSGISIKMYNDVVEKAQLSLGYLGSLSFTVPMFAWGLLKGGEYAMSSAVSAMTSGGGAAAQASSIGGQVGGLGNVSVGQKSFDSHSFRQSSAASSSFNYDNQVQGAMQRGTEISGLTGLTPMQQGKIASFTNTMSSIGQFNGAGGYSSFAVMSGLNGAMAAGTTFGNEQMANKAFKNDPDAMFKLGDAIAKTGATGKTATGIENITRETGATSDEAVNRLTAAGGRESAQSFFYNEAYYDKLMGGKGLSLSNLGEIQSRDPVAKMNTDRQISQAEHDMSALTNKQREVYTNWGIRTALENYNGNIESFYNRLGYFNTAESTGKMNAVQNYVDKHGMSYVDFFTGMNSHGQYFNRNIAWSNSGSELYSKGMSGRSWLTDNTNVTKEGTLYENIHGSRTMFYDNLNKTEGGNISTHYNNVTQNEYGASVDVGNMAGQAAMLQDSASIRASIVASIGGKGNEAKLWSDSSLNTAVIKDLVSSMRHVGSENQQTTTDSALTASARVGVGTPGYSPLKVSGGIDGRSSVHAANQSAANMAFHRLKEASNRISNMNYLTPEQKTSVFANEVLSVSQSMSRSAQNNNTLLRAGDKVLDGPRDVINYIKTR